MSTELPTCFGCFVNPAWVYSMPVPPPPPDFFTWKPTPEKPGLTEGEKEVLLLLVDAWNKFSALPDHVSHDLHEFCFGVHMLQQKLALRVARRVDPLIWRQPNGEGENEGKAEGEGFKAEGSEGQSHPPG